MRRTRFTWIFLLGFQYLFFHEDQSNKSQGNIPGCSEQPRNNVCASTR